LDVDGRLEAPTGLGDRKIVKTIALAANIAEITNVRDFIELPL
jgi:hypothetical protein